MVCRGHAIQSMFHTAGEGRPVRPAIVMIVGISLVVTGSAEGERRLLTIHRQRLLTAPGFRRFRRSPVLTKSWTLDRGRRLREVDSGPGRDRQGRGWPSGPIADFRFVWAFSGCVDGRLGTC